MKLNTHDINWIVNEYQAGRTTQEIAIDTGMSRQNVKRALAEAGLLTLSWYKTSEENKMLIALASKGISNVTQLLERL